MEEIIFSLNHYWRFVDSEALELQVLSYRFARKIARIQAELIERRSHGLSPG
jgi:hypothetical protein